jgi:phenylpropionate dioxygenase-like ring-hydroxylating dioxygenase large terminal subunit
MIEQTHSLRDPLVWPTEGLSRIPYRVYTDLDIYELEQRLIFQGPVWNFLGLEAEVPNPGDYKTAYVGNAPVVMVRKADGGISAVVNRCAHKGALLCYKPRGSIREFNCVYHNWTYDLDGNLTGIAFRKGVGGKGGLRADFDQSANGLVKLRAETYKGLVFASFSDETPAFADYLGAELIANIDRIFIKPVKVLGYHSQILPNNWKLYAENNKDSYHASLLHVFHNTFGVVRPNMGGGVKISANGWNHLSYSERGSENDDPTGREQVRSLKDQYHLLDPSLMEHRLEFGDRVTNAIQTVFPSLIIQQILNCLAVRQLIPQGVDRSELIWTVLGFENDSDDLTTLRLKSNNLVGPAGFISMEDGCVGGFVQRAAVADESASTIMPMGGSGIDPSQGSRVTEAAVRGFWKAWRECLSL